MYTSIFVASSFAFGKRQKKKKKEKITSLNFIAVAESAGTIIFSGRRRPRLTQRYHRARAKNRPVDKTLFPRRTKPTKYIRVKRRKSLKFIRKKHVKLFL